MPPRVVRPKTRLARLQQAPADPLDADEQTEQTPTRPTSPSPAPDVPGNANASSDGEQKEPDAAPAGDPRLFHGHRFYLARTVRTVRRHELRILITQNGGEVVTEMAGGAVEIVERAQLQPNENWVSAEFIEDSIEAGELKDVTQYMAPREPRPTRTPSGRPFKRFFSVAEQAAMLRFLKEQHPKYYNRATVPARIWQLAADQRLLDRTAQSMHEHYRKQLTKLTKKQRAVVFERAGVPNLDQDSIEGETEGETETDTEPRPRRVTAKTGEPERARRVADERAGEEEEESEDQPEKADQEPRPREPVEPTAHANGGDDSAESEDEIEGRAKKRVKKSRTAEQDREEQEQVEEASGPTAGEEGSLEPRREEISSEPQRKEEELSQPQTPPPTGESEQADAIEPSDKAQGALDLPLEANEEQNAQSQDQPEAPGGEVFRSYWHGIAFDPATRHQLDRFFIPPPPPPVVEHSQNALLSTPVASAQRTPQRSRRLSNSNEPSASHSTPTPQKRRRSGRTSMDSVGAPGSRTPARAAQEELLSQLEEMVGQRMTPPSRRKSLDRLIPVSQATESDADELLSRLQFETAHDLNTICSALYWSSGDSNVARAFLLGHSPAEIWSPKDDQLLVDYMREDVTEAELANARHRGAFETMSTRRTARDILQRIQFLL